MLRPKALPLILQQSISTGVRSAIIITMGGDLLATSDNLNSDKLVGAIVFNVWSLYQKNAEDLGCLLLDCEEGRLAIMKFSKFLVCVYGDHTCEFGMLKSKVQHFTIPYSDNRKTEALQKYLSENLKLPL